ncbi:molybdenum cofactor biosynthesis protein MoaE [Paenibacillus sp. LHD-117]|uniref:molybdenum cofactor biosynthesis protein n=1 Tax=Paenibacillus sp. LHD-117 TaxID=3071412 RepID=UPI0027E00BB5|nr:molybdenum cofactor biosynthesis protein MoaE [Paenibacillus sp. LHD-117]MDQ6418318.1 molybdenum cofactor biosynthesis protein MoaE [Paenibacillus sp. LHD-117]
MNHTWKIKLFAGLPERLGTAQLTLESESDQLTAGELKSWIARTHAEHSSLLAICFVARNHAYVADGDLIRATDELALLPPVSGGEELEGSGEIENLASAPKFAITNERIETDDVLAKVIVKEHGAAIAFVGTTREWTHGQRTVRLEYEAYEPMAVATMEQIGAEIGDRWPGALCAITHRIGVVGLAETSVVIAVSAPHREYCYEASRYAIERLKQIVPIWKKEIWEDGSEWKGHQLGPWDPTAALQPE